MPLDRSWCSEGCRRAITDPVGGYWEYGYGGTFDVYRCLVVKWARALCGLLGENQLGLPTGKNG